MDSIEKIKVPNTIWSKLAFNIKPDRRKTIKNLDNLKISAISVKLLSRKYDFNQGIYEEQLLIKYHNGQKQVYYYGSIPMLLINALRRHPRLLDFCNCSLFAREMKLKYTVQNMIKDDIDLVRLYPSAAIPILQNAIFNRTVDWDYYRDNLICETVRLGKNDEREQEGLTMKYNELNKYPDSKVASSNDEFNQLSNTLLGDFNDLVQGLKSGKVNKCFLPVG